MRIHVREPEASWSSGADGRFERRLRLGLFVTFLLLAAILVGFGVWFERPWSVAAIHAGSETPGPTPTLSLEVSR